MYRGETSGVAGVYDLFGGGGIEMGGRLDGEELSRLNSALAFVMGLAD